MTDFDLVLELVLLTAFSLLVVYLLAIREPARQRDKAQPGASAEESESELDAPTPTRCEGDQR